MIGKALAEEFIERPPADQRNIPGFNARELPRNGHRLSERPGKTLDD